MNKPTLQRGATPSDQEPLAFASEFTRLLQSALRPPTFSPDWVARLPVHLTLSGNRAGTQARITCGHAKLAEASGSAPLLELIAKAVKARAF